MELAKLLAARQYGVAMLAKVMTRRGHPITKQFLHQIGHGIRPAPVAQIEAIADVLECSQAERARMYRAAALDEGYEV